MSPFLNTFNSSVKMFHKTNPREVLLSKDNWRQKEATQFRVICDLECQLAIPDQTVLNSHYEGFSSEVSSLNIQYRSKENSPALSEWIMDTFPPIQGDDYVFSSFL
ncbi:hypothetical protein B9Z55_015427 [Caenorhabditis nigoni]|uniref:Uncharacterized protein n=1 Tax=Caenorhabditis nigoni TaxID=1611254 RepID=A0A2G5UA50_9PELO|nr:hypothetical protein B9Z55_015427 [Caenorhabditis nigoni]